MNLITAFIDGSAVYGSDDRLTKMLRKFSGGEMVENSEINGGFLPWSSQVDPGISESGRILAGDRRANEMPGLTVMHTCN
jgi:peroxidase